METKKLKLQGIAAGNNLAVDATTAVDNDNKKAAKVAGMAAAGVAAGVAAGYAGYEVYQNLKGDEAMVEAEPMTSDDVLDAVADLTADTPVAPAVEVQPEPVVAAEPVATTQPAATTTTTTTGTTVNPDEVSDEILAADIIDPVDAQTNDFPFEVGEVAQVYNVNGELETTTTITSEDGTELTLVDVNGDQMFDVVRDVYGNEENLGVVSTVSDMEMLHAQQHGDTTGYLAASDTDPMAGDDSFEADIIDPTTLG